MTSSNNPVFSTGEDVKILKSEDFIEIISDFDSCCDSSGNSARNLFLMGISNIADDLIRASGCGGDKAGDITKDTVEVNELNLLHFKIMKN